MVEAQTFRADLLYRLAVFPIVIAPLRERKSEIDALASHILERLARRFGRSAPLLTRTTLARLRAHEWPGNVRELENVLERSLLLSPGRELVLALTAAAKRRTQARTYREAAIQCIRDALAASEGRIYGEEGAAAVLHLKPTTLQSKMKKLGIGR